MSQVSRRARILLVDDRPENLFALEEILAPLDQILVSVRTGEQAVRAVRPTSTRSCCWTS